MTEKTLRDIVEALHGKRVLIVGDVMLDEYVWGEVRRISPEAPVPVVTIQQRTYRPGGAGNVAANIASLGGTPVLIGVVGQDSMGSQLELALSEMKMETADILIPLSDRPTTVKSRVVAHNQQILRLDTETNLPISEQVEDAILAWAGQHVGRVDVCVISDYAKGMMTDRVCRGIIEKAIDHRVPIVVDPKGHDYRKYAGATVVTPNIHEAIDDYDGSRTTNLDLDQRVAHLLGLLAGASILVTQGAQGMSLYRHGRHTIHIPANARNVFDVTGAGDTVVGTLALALAAGASLEQAACLANFAAGVVVGKLGTAIVARDELLEAIKE